MRLFYDMNFNEVPEIIDNIIKVIKNGDEYFAPALNISHKNKQKLINMIADMGYNLIFVKLGRDHILLKHIVSTTGKWPLPDHRPKKNTLKNLFSILCDLQSLKPVFNSDHYRVIPYCWDELCEKHGK